MNRYDFLLAALLLASTALFVSEMTGYLRRDPNPIGYVALAEGVVARLPRDRYSWDELKPGSLLSLGDAISTDDSGAAKLVLYRGDEIALDPSSMVVLGNELQDIGLSYLRGVPEPRRKAAAIVASAPKPQPKPKLLAPIVSEREIRHPEKAMAARGEVLSISRLPPSPEIVFPPDESFFDMNTTRAVNFRWKLPGNARDAAGLSYELLIKPLSSAKPAVILPSKVPSLSLKDLPTGRYAWSVRTVRRDGARSPATLMRKIKLTAREHLSKPVYLPSELEN